MKTLQTILIVLFLPLVALSQDIFEKYRDNNKATYVSITPSMLKMLAKMDIDTTNEEAQNYLDMVNSITSFKTLTTGEKEIAKDISKWVISKASQLDELMNVKENGTSVTFYGKTGKNDNRIKEVLITVTGLAETLTHKSSTVTKNEKPLETVVVLLTGDIALNQIYRLARKMNLPGSKILENNSKN